MPSPPLATTAVSPIVPAPRRRRHRWPVGLLVFLGMTALFVAGIVRLFDLRFSTGEVFSPYSTLRGDPLGAKALYYSLQELPGLRVERNVRPLRYLGEEPSAVLQHRDDDPNPTGNSGATAVVYLGASPFEWPFLTNEPETNRLETIMNRGGRVIMAFLPTTVALTTNRLKTNRREQRHRDQEEADRRKEKEQNKEKGNEKDKDSAKSSPSKTDGTQTPPPAKESKSQNKGNAGGPDAKPTATPGKSDDEDSDDDNPGETPAPTLSPSEKIFAKQDLITRWHVDFHRTSTGKKETAPLPASTDETASPVVGSPGEFTPVAWHTAADFDLDLPDTAKAGWHALYKRSGRPVIAARPFGTEGGELILISDPYFFSNEALRKEPHPELLSMLIGPCRRIIFDETHLGVAENPGMMTLARRYHLQGALYALAVLAILFLWKNMVSLVPPPTSDEQAAQAVAPGNFVTGRDSAEGFVNLLRRGVPPRELLKMCLTQWRTSNALPGSRVPGAALVAKLDAIAEAEAAKPVHRRSMVSAYHAMCAALKQRGEAAPKV